MSTSVITQGTTESTTIETPSDSRLTLLLIDDDDVDQEVMRRALVNMVPDHVLHVAQDGVQAINMVLGADGYRGIHAPLLIVLDLHMPRMNGLEFLDALRSTRAFRHTPVFVLTTSDHQDDIAAAHGKGISGYVTKHRDGSSCRELAAMLDSYWKLTEQPL